MISHLLRLVFEILGCLIDRLWAAIQADGVKAFTSEKNRHDALTASHVQNILPLNMTAYPVNAGLRFPHKLLPHQAIIGFGHSIVDVDARLGLYAILFLILVVQFLTPTATNGIGIHSSGCCIVHHILEQPHDHPCHERQLKQHLRYFLGDLS